MSLILSFNDWPEVDRAMWAALRQHGGPFDDRGALAVLRETSVETLRNRYGRWLEWLRRNEPAALAEPPTARATLPRLRHWLTALEHTAPMTRLMFVDGLLRVLMAAAPEADWTAHRRVKAHLKHAAGRGDPSRKQGRVLSSRVLLEAGLRLAGLEADAIGNELRRAEAKRDDTMVALLAMMPMRRRAFSGLTLGESLIVDPESLIIALPDELTKTGVAWEAEVPEPAASALRRYLEEARPFLMARRGQRHAKLWVDRKGRPYREHQLSVRIAETTLNLTGKRIPPHLFRDAAATTLVRESPESARLVRPVLAHLGFETAERHYIQARRGWPGLCETAQADEGRSVMRAAVYARFSTTLQREASIEDQERLCRERAEREGWQVVDVFADRALSGASMLRPGLQALLDGAQAGKIDVVVTEALDRLSRDQADVAALYKRLSFAGVTIVTLAEGEISELDVGLKGTMNQLFLKDLAAKTRRGLRGRVEQGLSDGGNSYGYRVVRRLGSDVCCQTNANQSQ